MPVQREIMEKAVRQVLEEAKVPAAHHLRVIQLLHDRMKEHQGDINAWRKIADHHEKHLQQHDYIDQAHEQQINAYSAELERSRQIAKGEPGEPGEDGYTPQKGIDYFDGETPDTEEIIHSVLLRIPPPEKGEPGKNAEFDEKAFMNKLLGRLKNEQILDLSHIKGAQGFIKDGVKYRFEELMHGGGGGTNTTTSSSTAPTISINLPTSGLVNSSNTTYTYRGQASLVVVDSKIDVNALISFTNGVTTITTSTPPQNNMYVISGNYLTQQVPTESINGSNTAYTCSFPVYLTIVDNEIDQDAIQSFNPTQGITNVTTSTPPQNSVLLVGGGGMNPQVPTGTKNSSNTSFSAVGLVTVAVIESSIDVNATLIYNSASNATIITYSIPPQSTDEIYAF